ncbi:hypothetical protein [Niallia sp.]|uniref:hypothetical protein n=1 Tax=Niallia sp. TaxID=2837523 RepID=UPI0028A0DE5A|nr:hypothetical protein [Niallia sp.]
MVLRVINNWRELLLKIDERYIIYISSYLYGTIPTGDKQIYDTETEQTEPLEMRSYSLHV